MLYTDKNVSVKKVCYTGGRNHILTAFFMLCQDFYILLATIHVIYAIA